MKRWKINLFSTFTIMMKITHRLINSNQISMKLILIKYFVVNETFQICTDNRTTLMIRNVPNNYSKEMLIEEIDDRFKGKFDFFNLHYDN